MTQFSTELSADVEYSLYVIDTVGGTRVEDIFTPKVSKATIYHDKDEAVQSVEDMRGYLGGFYGVNLELCSITDEDLFQRKLAGT